MCVGGGGVRTIMWQIRPNILSNSSTNLTGYCIFKFYMFKDFFLLQKCYFWEENKKPYRYTKLPKKLCIYGMHYLL